MAENLKRMSLIGNLGRDAETRVISDKLSVTTTSVAVNYETANGEKHVDWVKVNVWNGRGEALAGSLTKGRLMYFEGTPRVEAWLKDGEARAQLVLNVNSNDTIRFLSSGSGQPEPADEAEIPF